MNTASSRSTRHLVPTSYGFVHVRDDGPLDAPVVLLVHETPTDSTAWDLVVPHLAEEFRVLAPDTPGHGGSDPLPPGPVAGENYALVLSTVLDRLAIDRVVVVGVHTGALFAVHLAAGPGADHVAGLVLTGPPVYDEEVRAASAATDRSLPVPRSDGGHFTQVWEAVSRHTRLVDHRTRIVCQVLLGGEPYRAYEAVFASDLRPTLARVVVPVLLLTVPGDSLAEAETEVSRIVEDTTVRRLDGEVPVYRTEPEAYAAAVAEVASRWLA